MSNCHNYMTSRRWCWTLNNYQDEDITLLQSVAADLESSGVRYLVWGFEIGEQGTPHLQGYVEFCSTKRMTGVKKTFGLARMHCEIAKGTGLQNREYCSKDGLFEEHGEMRSARQGKRSDLDAVKEAIDDGMSELDLANNFFGVWVRNRASFERYRALRNAPVVTSRFSLDTFPEEWPRDYDWSRTIIFSGPSGIGKTEFAKAILPNALMVSHMDDLGKFQPSLHSGIIFDDVDINHFPRTSQIHLVDQDNGRSIHIRYGCAFIPANTKKIFTTNTPHGECMLVSDPAIARRVKVHTLLILE